MVDDPQLQQTLEPLLSRCRRKRGPLAIMDVDSMVYVVALSWQQTHNWGEHQTTTLRVPEEEIDLVADLEARFAEWVEWLPHRPSAYVVPITDKAGNWRYRYYESYKANRRESTPPLLLNQTYAALEELVSRYPNMVMMREPALEADDICGVVGDYVLAHHFDVPVVVLSQDKDLRQAACTCLAVPRSQTLVPYDWTDAVEYHAMQTLAGDLVDGYPGLPGVGMKRAKGLLGSYSDAAELWTHVYKAYRERDYDYDFMLSQARSAFILDHNHYNFTTQEVRPWTPPFDLKETT